MEIGEKIKTLRNQRRMTQTALAGDQITRNMLSLIENGSALPSLSTILYLAERLDIPAGLLLARDQEELMYRKSEEMARIKQAYAAGEYKLCLARCQELLSVGPDDEIRMITAKCHLFLGREAFDMGRFHEACAELDKACEREKQNFYRDESIPAMASVYFRYMARLSQTLCSDAGYENYEGTFLGADAFCKYAYVLWGLEKGDTAIAQHYLQIASPSEKEFSEHIRARLEMGEKKYHAAGLRLEQLIAGNDITCRGILYDVFGDREICCRECGDYKGAYEYSVGKMNLLERMLSDRNF
ncbi:MAG: helix-turn-helix domain-containing protein [Clostridia bacterium]|nr:helix-turn-helix domain-containing protein [Clostridia bacterium]